MIKPLMCLAKGHSVNRNRVWHDGRNYRSRCTVCSRPLLRDHGNWRKFDLQEDASEARELHPRTGEIA